MVSIADLAGKWHVSAGIGSEITVSQSGVIRATEVEIRNITFRDTDDLPITCADTPYHPPFPSHQQDDRVSKLRDPNHFQNQTTSNP